MASITARAPAAMWAALFFLSLPALAEGDVIASPKQSLLETRTPAPLPSPAPSRSIDDLAAAIRSWGFSAPALRALGYPVIVWAPSRPGTIRDALRAGVSGVVTDRPDTALDILRGWTGDGAAAGSLLGPDGAADAARFDVQGHRGAAALRPENTLPAMEAALDLGVSGLEMDVQGTSDGYPVLSHDAYLRSTCCRRGDGASFHPEEIWTRTLDTIQVTYICDRMPVSVSQRNGKALSPVANAYARDRGFPDPYTPPSLRQVLDFVEFYAAWYETGSGASDPAATKRAAVARRVRFSVEAKGNGQAEARLTRSIVAAIRAAGASSRSIVLSRNPEVLRSVRAEAPEIGVAWVLEGKP